METILRKQLLACKTQHAFDMILYDLVANTTYLSEWISINAIFGENQKAWREKLVQSLKKIYDGGIYGREITFTENYTKFKIFEVVGFKENFDPLRYVNQKADISPPETS
jgi:hypothetical protein